MKYLQLLLAVSAWPVLLVLRLALILLGLVVVPLALPFSSRGVSLSDGRDINILPQWAWLWSNDYDGTDGDKRGWWAENTPFGLPVEHFVSRYTWTALRNPVNNLRFTDLGSAPASDLEYTLWGSPAVADKPQEGGFQLVLGTLGWKAWAGLYYVHEWSATRAFVVRLGFKIRPDHAGQGETKGMTFKCNPYKAI